MSPRVVAIIQARMNSSRFPGKVLTQLYGKQAIFRLIDRLQNCRELDGIIVATTNSINDDEFARYLQESNIRYYRGNEDDVLSRVFKASLMRNADIIVDITADCPLVDPKEVDAMVRFAIDGGYDYVSNVINSDGQWVRHVPDGFDIQVYTAGILKDINAIVPPGPHRSHTGWNIINYQNKFAYKLNIGSFPKCYPMDVDLTLDTPEDADLLSDIFKRLEHKQCFSFDDVIKLLNDNSGLAEINKSVKRKIPGDG